MGGGAWDRTFIGVGKRLHARRWTDEEDAILARLFREGRTWEEISRALGGRRTASAAYERAQKLGHLRERRSASRRPVAAVCQISRPPDAGRDARIEHYRRLAGEGRPLFEGVYRGKHDE